MHELSTPELLELLRSRQIKLRREGARLTVSAPRGGCDENLRRELARRKGELLALLGEVHECEAATPDPARSRRIPLSFAQERLWVLDRFHHGDISYNIPHAWQIEGALDRAALELAVNSLIVRHAALRTAIDEDEGAPFQSVHAEVPVALAYTDLSNRPVATHPAALAEFFRADTRRRFDLRKAPLVRFHLIELAPERHVLYFNVHHIVADAWSLGIMRDELESLYQEKLSGVPAHLPVLHATYADYATNERARLSEGLLAGRLKYWGAKLAGAPLTLSLPPIDSRSRRDPANGAARSFRIDPETTNALAALGRSEAASLFMTLLAAFSVLLAEYSGQGDIAVLSPLSDRYAAQAESIVGLFVNLLVLRCQPRPSLSFRPFLREIRETTLEAFTHGDLPFQNLLADLRRSRRSEPVFSNQIVFTYEKSASTGSLTPVEIDTDTAKFDLHLHVNENARGLDARFEYSTAAFDQTSIERLGGRYRELLAAIARRPDRLLGDLTASSSLRPSVGSAHGAGRADPLEPATRAGRKWRGLVAARLPFVNRKRS